MMTDATTRFVLPYLAAGQAQKEITHNEALARLDLLVAATVEAMDANAPPATPLPGQAWLLGSAPTDAWAGQAGALAGWTESGWRFAAPVEGLRVRVRSNGMTAVYTGGGWELGTVDAARLKVAGTQVIGAQQAAIAGPSGGATSDDIARETIGHILQVLRTHGLIASS